MNSCVSRSACSYLAVGTCHGVFATVNWGALGTGGARAIDAYVQPMGAVLQIPCAQCLSKNRVPQARLSDTPICGKCKAHLFPDHPAQITDASFTSFVEASELPVIVD